MLEGFVRVAIAQFLGTMSPGPNVALIIRNSVMHSRKMGICTAVGIAMSVCIHLTYCVLGVAVILSQSALFFNILKYAGGAFLITLGIKSCLKRYSPLESGSPGKPLDSYFQAIKEGFLCNLFNPQAIFIYIGIFSLVIQKETPHRIQVLYALEMVTIVFTLLCTLAIVIGRKTIQDFYRRYQSVLGKLTGLVFVFFGVELMLLRHI